MPDSYHFLLLLITSAPHRVTASGGDQPHDRPGPGAPRLRFSDCSRRPVEDSTTPGLDHSPSPAVQVDGPRKRRSARFVRGGLPAQATYWTLQQLVTFGEGGNVRLALAGSAQKVTDSPTPVAAFVARVARSQVSKRTLQQRIHRLTAVNFNPALDGLVAVGLVQRDGRGLLSQPTHAPSSFSPGSGLLIAVVHSRTMRQPERRRQHRQRNGAGGDGFHRSRRSVDGQFLAATLTRAVGRWRCSDDFGGLAPQAGYRARGVKATEKATRILSVANCQSSRKRRLSHLLVANCQSCGEDA